MKESFLGVRIMTPNYKANSEDPKWMLKEEWEQIPAVPETNNE
jgi:hypothetical protein